VGPPATTNAFEFAIVVASLTPSEFAIANTAIWKLDHPAMAISLKAS
jgi:hypothetical protein